MTWADPATASSIVVTTFTDVGCLAVFLGLAAFREKFSQFWFNFAGCNFICAVTHGAESGEPRQNWQE